MPRYGQNHHNATLTDQQVREIRNIHMAYINGRGYACLAKKYGVGVSTIRDIVTYRTRRNA